MNDPEGRPTLDYEPRPPPTGPEFLRHLLRVSGPLFRRAGLAFGLALFGIGLDAAIRNKGGDLEHVSMAVGGLLVGLTIPLPRSTRPPEP